MTSGQTVGGEEMVVLKDQDGHDYVVPRTSIEVGRVADESVDRLHDLFDQDVEGYSFLQFSTLARFEQQGIIIVGGFPLLSSHGIIIVGGRGPSV
jgi:hypothetical protein